MSGPEIRVDDRTVEPAAGWTIAWVDRDHGVARMVNATESIPVLVEGRDSDWVVTLRGRRIAVSVLTWRERILADADSAARDHSGPIQVKATLPGLVVAVAVAAGDEVEEGISLLTIEAMKMQNEVRSPRAGRIIEVSVANGQTVATGAPLLRIE